MKGRVRAVNRKTSLSLVSFKVSDGLLCNIRRFFHGQIDEWNSVWCGGVRALKLHVISCHLATIPHLASRNPG
jgi:hypothetical protein